MALSLPEDYIEKCWPIYEFLPKADNIFLTKPSVSKSTTVDSLIGTPGDRLTMFVLSGNSY